MAELNVRGHDLAVLVAEASLGEDRTRDIRVARWLNLEVVAGSAFRETIAGEQDLGDDLFVRASSLGKAAL